MFISERTGELLEQAERAAERLDFESDEAALTRLTRRAYDKARLVPSRLAAELARAGSTGQEAWVAARATSDFAAFAPHLEHNLALAREYVDCFEDFDCAYDALLDDYEPGMRASGGRPAVRRAARRARAADRHPARARGRRR